MNGFLIVQNDPLVAPGHIMEAMKLARATYEVFPAYREPSIPPFADYAGVVVLGGGMGVYDADDHPYLHGELQAIADGARSAVPMLGLCLGGQLMAAALGGSVARGPRPEAALAPLPATTDPLLGLLDRPHLVIHQDGWHPPPGATSLVEGPSYQLAFRHGSAVALQTHPEVTPGIAARWFAEPEVQALTVGAGVDPEEFLETILDGAEGSRDMALSFFAAWIAEARAAVTG